jgi:hypothetical protein
MAGPPYQGVGGVYPASPQIIVDLDHMCFQVFIKISTYHYLFEVCIKPFRFNGSMKAMT